MGTAGDIQQGAEKDALGGIELSTLQRCATPPSGAHLVKVIASKTEK